MDELTPGMRCYRIYGNQVGWIDFLDDPMPNWDELPSTLQAGWEAVGAAKILEEQDGRDL